MRAFRKRRLVHASSRHIVIFLFIILFGIIILFFIGSPKSQAKNVVEEFYSYEQDGDFASSWNLLHSEIQARFSEDQYIERRSNLFLELGISTFQYDLDNIDVVKNWTTSSVNLSFQEIYKVPVRQIFQSEFGVLTLEQDLYVAEENGEWRILWSNDE